MAPRHRLPLAVAALLAFTGCVAVDAGPAPAPESDGDIAALESAFWYCDWVATHEGVLATPMAACRFATSELKARKFGGSSRALAAWWAENKAAEHGRLERTARK
jgi:hypothetical protein